MTKQELEQMIKNEVDAVIEAVKLDANNTGIPMTPQNEAYFRMGISCGFPLVSKILSTLSLDKIVFVDFMEELSKNIRSNE